MLDAENPDIVLTNRINMNKIESRRSE